MDTMTEKQPKVSVIIPVYNAGEYIRPCLDSLVNQTLREIEIICVLDCPTDGTDKVVEEYAAKDSRIVVIHNERNMHTGESRNRGIQHARGEYVCFHDADDTCDNNRLEQLYLATDKGKKKIVISGVLANQILNPPIAVIKEYLPYQRAFLLLLQRSVKVDQLMYGHITPNLYSHQVIKDNNLLFADSRKCWAEDILFNNSFLNNIHNDNEMNILTKSFYHYRNHEQGIHVSRTYTDFNHILSYLNELYRIINDNREIDRAIMYDLFYCRIVQMLYTCFLLDIREFGFFKSYKKYRTVLSKSYMIKDVIFNGKWILSGLTLPKRLFIFWLKYILKH